MQARVVDRTGVATAIAATVPLHPEDASTADSDPPYATLRLLPADGILIFATFTTRGDPAEDVHFSDGTLPLEIGNANAQLSPTAAALAGRLRELRLRVAVGGYNVDATIYYGSARPSAEMVATAQRQLDQLVVASERVTLFTRSSVAGPDQAIRLYGSVDSGKQGEVVTVQARDCGQRFFRAVAGATTRSGGGWSTEYFAGISTTLRAVWDDASSPQITIQQRPLILLRTRPGGRFEVVVSAKAQFWRKHVLFERFNRRLGTWTKVRSVVLTKQGTGAPGRSPFVQTSATFTASVPKGVLVRAALPLSQARPCYLAGVSKLVRT